MLPDTPEKIAENHRRIAQDAARHGLKARGEFVIVDTDCGEITLDMSVYHPDKFMQALLRQLRNIWEEQGYRKCQEDIRSVLNASQDLA